MDAEVQSGRTFPLAGAGTETVLIQVPADADYLPVIRSASAHVATKAGCTLSEVADLRLAVDEACGLLLRHTVRVAQPAAGAGGAGSRGAQGEQGDQGDLVCRFTLDGTSLRVVLSRDARNAAPPQDDEFGWTILSALVDDIQWQVDGPTVHVEILKRRTAGE